MKRLNHGDLERAKRELAVARGHLKNVSRKAGKSVADAYSHVRLALEAISQTERSKVDAEARSALDRAVAALHSAEDELVKASGGA